MIQRRLLLSLPLLSWATLITAILTLSLVGMAPAQPARDAQSPAPTTGTFGRTLVSGPAFPVFDATLYLKKPDLEQLYGMPRLRTHKRLWMPEDNHDEPIRARLVAALAHIPRGELIFMDIEHWPVKGQPEVVNDTLRKYNLVTHWVREIRPDLTFGYYGVPPIRDYWRAVRPERADQYQQWLDENDALAPMVENLDVIYPSLYTFYNTPDQWVEFAKANLSEARQYGLPVYAFLWPQYHEGNKELAWQFIDPDFWRRQLETCLEHADGIVIWGGWMDADKKRLNWDPTAPWWRETIAVMAENGDRLLNPKAD
ncbi:hypothetical protein [Mucisphaera sp.]|uniref:hypothetical protein n=1 Tax=Mucisphaera sp. TaxID=2913024 RepID=UPI003D0CD768